MLPYLSLNKNYLGDDFNKQNRYMAQAFKTAGDIFDVIDAATEGVIVYYNDDAERIINALLSDIDHEEAVNLLREAQKYTVSVYSYGIRKMRENDALIHIDTVNVLRKEFYDKETGIKLDGGLMEILGM